MDRYSYGSDDAAIISAALQDHMARKFKSALAMPPRLKRAGTQAAQKARRKTPVASRRAVRSTAASSAASSAAAAAAAALRWTCETCTLLNDAAAVACAACSAAAPASTVDDASFTRYRPKSTLAQDLGLVAKPAPALTEAEWAAVQTSSTARGDSAVESECAICREPFHAQKQVLLSCTHVFHKVCLQNFERLCCASERSCPICRHRKYQKRMITEGAVQFERAACVAVQCAWRTARARRDLAARREAWLQGGGGDPARRQRWVTEQIAERSARLDAAAAGRQSAVESVLRSISDNLVRTRDVVARVELKATVDWARSAAAARGREESSCPICMGDLGALSGAAQPPLGPTCGPPAASLRRAARAQKAAFARPCSLLSCSHVFHAKCLDAFEAFALDQGSGDCLCPICRQAYLRMPL